MTSKTLWHIYLGLRNLFLCMLLIFTIAMICRKAHAESFGMPFPIEIHVPNKEEVVEYYNREWEKEHPDKAEERRESEKEMYHEHERDDRWSPGDRE